jgi:tRNA A-37 threonylcarbamoyl transferase component Bud32
VNCPKCRTENPSGSKFCRECATPIPSPGSKDQASFTRTFEIAGDELTRGILFAGRYEIIEELGAGGMGTVYRAFDKKIDEEVALKLLKPAIATDKRIVERFRNELKIARKIRHAHVCGMFDLGEEGEKLFISMEYVRGEDLKSVIHRLGNLTVGKALSIARQVAEGLAEAHKLRDYQTDTSGTSSFLSQLGQAAPGVLDFGEAGIGVFPKVEEFQVLGFGLRDLSRSLIQKAQAVMVEGMDKISYTDWNILLDLTCVFRASHLG